MALGGDRHPEGPGLRTGRSPHRLPRRLWLAGQPAFIDLLRDEGADVRVHPARDGQEGATVAREGGMSAQHPFEACEVGRLGKIGRASVRERGCPEGLCTVVDVYFTDKKLFTSHRLYV